MTPKPARILPRATLRLAAVVALAVTLLSLIGMGLQYRLVAGQMMQAQTALLAADLDGFAALYDQRRIIALRQAIEYRAAAATQGELLLLQDRSGTLLAGTQANWPNGLPVLGEGFFAEKTQIFQHALARCCPRLAGGVPVVGGPVPGPGG
jgi:hypothetical protein